VPHTYREREGILEFARNGSRIITGHFKDEADIDSYLGLEYDIIGIEESTTLSKQKKDDVRGCLRSSKTAPFRWRPRVYETTNPGGISHASFKKTYILPMREGREADTRFIPATAHDNPALNPEYRTKVLGRYTGWQKQAWADGNWDIESGQYFANFRYETHVRPAAGFEVQRGWDVWGGLDHGLVHYTTFYLLCRDGDGHLYAVAEHAARGWLPSQHAEAIHDLLARRGLTIADIGPVLAGHDCFARRTTQDGEIGTVADDYAAAGIALERANISRLSGAKELYRRLGAEAQQGAAAVPATLTILDSCPRLFECIPSLQRDPRNPEDVLKVDCDDDGEGGDDPYDGFRYGYMKYAAMPRVSTAPTVVGPRRDFATLVVR
jgi:phage terminase large subunit